MTITLKGIEDYYVAKALFELGSMVENDDILDKVYENEEKRVEIDGSYLGYCFTAIFEKD